MEHSHLFTAQDLFLTAPFLIVLAVYSLAVIKSNAHYRKWPKYRIVFWFLGIFIVMITIIGPVADRAHSNFIHHMTVHLLLGMLAPLLLALSKPITLIYRTLPVCSARELSRFLKSWPAQMYCHPIVASILNMGGLWILYTTDLFSAMHHHIFLHILVHIHVFVAGYLFTISMIYVEPVPHRYSFVFRAAISIMAFAAHGILAKYIYGHPPTGVEPLQAEAGGMLMYYGGDAVDIILISIFCYQWYKSGRPRVTISIGK
ncbi:putative membrane protein [Bacillus oleivorans]|uniref:Putative membrane protein n=1 Tax=Bacillus oleivorans TaxID=1448271 RepID=A0A285CMB0_9BACI|nr:cytochrome c oxidase assembly protein [Bacillus oleivorans]SNX68684.1 putative membrane protein [Bacillus oleivorans]